MKSAIVIAARSMTQKFQFLHQKSLSTPAKSIGTLPKAPDLPLLISSICRILRNGGKWEALNSFFTSVDLDETLAERIILNLKEPPDAKNALLFFHWSSQRKLRQHSLKTYCIVVHILVGANLLADAQALMESAIARNPDPDSSKNLIAETLLATHESVASDPRVFDLFVRVLMKMRFLQRAFDSCCYFSERGIILSLRSFNGLLLLCRTSNQNHLAWKVYEEMLERRVYPNQTSFETMVNLMCKEGSLKRNLALLDIIHGKRCAPAVLLNMALLLRIFEENRVDRGLLLLRRLLQKNLIFDDVMNSLIIFAYCRIGMFELATKAHEDMRSRGCGSNAFVYTCFVENRCREGRIDEALNLVKEMRSLLLKPYGETYNCLIEGCAKAGKLKECLAFYDALENGGFAVSFSALREIVEILCANGEVERADEIITSVSERGVVCDDEDIHCNLINGFGRAGRGEKVLNLYHEMRYRGLVVSPRVYAALVDSLRRCGKMKDAEKFSCMMGGFVENSPVSRN
ncbi:Pentatricopeptide repeat-containing protein [Platanthera zijinensis]|uniref:Pentatricopeptide repeat-containing protein n=1 Tax=Platanthera zijinensis TaxID=2320716 RepID=A0AAP0G988_9ASPA